MDTALDDPESGDVGFPASDESCALLEDGDSTALDAGDDLSDTHILMRCTELSKLLQALISGEARTDGRGRDARLLDVGRVHLHERSM